MRSTWFTEGEKGQKLRPLERSLCSASEMGEEERLTAVLVVADGKGWGLGRLKRLCLYMLFGKNAPVMKNTLKIIRASIHLDTQVPVHSTGTARFKFKIKMGHVLMEVLRCDLTLLRNIID